VRTSIVSGATPERFEIVKWFYIEADDDTGYDAAADVTTGAPRMSCSRRQVPSRTKGVANGRRDRVVDGVVVEVMSHER
jgi:DNA segregation ATPase FtsK/SpoIIIE, S-DNA-T family